MRCKISSFSIFSRYFRTLLSTLKYNAVMQKIKPIPHQHLQLPAPSEAAVATSRTLLDFIQQAIAQEATWFSFARYMELALYTPRLGYYSGGSAKLGSEGDFTTAPEMTPLFGASLAQFYQQHRSQIPAQVMEFGAGSGRLAFDFLTQCHSSNIEIDRYFIVELSGELRARQEELLQGFPQVRWLDEMPQHFSGLVMGNEVLDAMPVDLLIKTEQGWQECGVISDGKGELGLCYRQVNEQLLAQIPDAATLPYPYMTEVHRIASGFMRSLSQMCYAGMQQNQQASLIVLIDYGFPAHEFYHPERHSGSLMCHYRHHAHSDPFYLPGLQDITAHVDFTQMARCGLDEHMDLLCYTSQAAFLLNAGITQVLEQQKLDEMQYLRSANLLQKLISPAEMGELFKVLVLGCGVELNACYAAFDRSERL
jgi:SAM-dependent MidA family methyltransferase